MIQDCTNQIPKQHMDKIHRLTKKFETSLKQKYPNDSIKVLGSVTVNDIVYLVALNEQTGDAFLFNDKHNKYRKYGFMEMDIIMTQVSNYTNYLEQKEMADKGVYQ